MFLPPLPPQPPMLFVPDIGPRFVWETIILCPLGFFLSRTAAVLLELSSPKAIFIGALPALIVWIAEMTFGLAFGLLFSDQVPSGLILLWVGYNFLPFFTGVISAYLGYSTLPGKQ